MTSYTIKPADEATVRKFLHWRYDAPYHVYNLLSRADEIEEHVRYFTDPQTACYTLTDRNEELVAYCTFGLDARVPGGDYSGPALDIGLGVRPDLTGQGRGLGFVAAVITFAREAFSPQTLRVTVAAFNGRALRVWEKAGFQRVQDFRRVPDGMAFVVLARDA